MIWRRSPHIFWRRSGYKLGKEGALEAEKESMMIISPTHAKLAKKLGC